MRTSQPRVVADEVSRNDRKSALTLAKSGLQGFSNLAAFAPLPGIALCLPIVISIIESIDVRSTINTL